MPAASAEHSETGRLIIIYESGALYHAWDCAQRSIVSRWNLRIYVGMVMQFKEEQTNTVEKRCVVRISLAAFHILGTSSSEISLVGQRNDRVALEFSLIWSQFFALDRWVFRSELRSESECISREQNHLCRLRYLFAQGPKSCVGCLSASWSFIYSFDSFSWCLS